MTTMAAGIYHALIMLVLTFETAFATVEQASVTDLRRAATRAPHRSYQGDGFAAMNKVLNGHIEKIAGLATASCRNFSAQQLQDHVLAPLFEHAQPELLAIYAVNGDRRQRIHSNLQETRAEWARLKTVTEARPDLLAMHRDGLCHQAVMWYVHHLSQSRRKQVAAQLVLPLLPMHYHAASGDADSAHAEVHADYESKVSCQQCHVGPVWKSWVDATLPPPLPVDPVHPGRERLKSCDYQNKPPCGPCEGLGGPRHGDGVEEFDPMNCTVVSLPVQVPESARPTPAFPALGSASIVGETRSPLAVRPDPKKPGKYPKVNASISLAWTAGVRRQRYDFQGMPPFGKPMAQIYLQTEEQVKSGNSSGVMVTIAQTSKYTPDVCVCMDAVAGNMDIDSFVPHSKHDPLDLPAEEGGLAYLGRVKVELDANDQRIAIADHYMKWAFHFLVDADQNSESYGLPLRLYGQQGVRFVYSKWDRSDPEARDPELFKIPKHCLSASKTCRETKRQQAAKSSNFVEFV